jgi:hypothetical protein
MTQRIAGAWTLAEEQLLQLFLVVPVHTRGIYVLCPLLRPAQDLEVVPIEK